MAISFGVLSANLREPINRAEYRVLGTITVLGALLGATIGYIAVARWDAALVIATLSIPGSMLGGLVAVLSLRWQRATKRPEAAKRLTVPQAIFVLVIGVAIVVALQHVIPSLWIRVTVYCVAGAVYRIVRYVYQRKRK